LRPDSPAEEEGFELSVLPERNNGSNCPVSTSWHLNSAKKTDCAVKRDRGFESFFLQR
jgi:hypothetical protein